MRAPAWRLRFEDAAMTWIHFRQQQQRGAQLHARGETPRQPGEAPKEAVDGREAQDHDRADLDASGGRAPRTADYPASDIAHRDQDNTPTAPDARVDWDDVVQPERNDARGRRESGSDLPLPEGK